MLSNPRDGNEILSGSAKVSSGHTTGQNPDISAVPFGTSPGFTIITDIATFAAQPDTKTVLTTLTTTIHSTLPADFSTKTLNGPLPTRTWECPDADGTAYNFDKGYTQVFKKYCNTSTPLAPFIDHNTFDMDGCIDICAEEYAPDNVTCLAATFKFSDKPGFHCSLISGVGKIVNHGNLEMAVLISFVP
jgi:hypothetical protein